MGFSPLRALVGGGTLLVLLAVAAGCGSGVGSVSGKVFYQGKLVKGGNVTFVSTEGKPSKSTSINEDGSYSLDKLLAVAGGVAGVALWFGHHLRAARAAVGLGHNLAAIEHLSRCRRVWADHPETLLLCATATRRAGNWNEAEAFLDSYWRQRGDDE